MLAFYISATCPPTPPLHLWPEAVNSFHWIFVKLQKKGLDFHLGENFVVWERVNAFHVKLTKKRADFLLVFVKRSPYWMWWVCAHSHWAKQTANIILHFTARFRATGIVRECARSKHWPLYFRAVEASRFSFKYSNFYPLARIQENRTENNAGITYTSSKT